MMTRSPAFKVSFATPSCVSLEGFAHSAENCCSTPFSSGAITRTQAWGWVFELHNASFDRDRQIFEVERCEGAWPYRHHRNGAGYQNEQVRVTVCAL